MCFPSIHNHGANISYNFKINSKIKNQLQLYPSFGMWFKLVLEIKHNAIYLFIYSFLFTISHLQINQQLDYLPSFHTILTYVHDLVNIFLLQDRWCPRFLKIRFIMDIWQWKWQHRVWQPGSDVAIENGKTGRTVDFVSAAFTYISSIH